MKELNHQQHNNKLIRKWSTMFAEEQLSERDKEKAWECLWKDIVKLQKSDKSMGQWIEEMDQKYKLAKR